MKEIFILSLIVASISFTISEAAIFRKLRIRVKLRSVFFGKLIHCGYCCSFWVAVPIMILYQPRLYFLFSPLDYLFTWFALAWIAGAQWAIMAALFKIGGK